MPGCAIYKIRTIAAVRLIHRPRPEQTKCSRNAPSYSRFCTSTSTSTDTRTGTGNIFVPYSTRTSTSTSRAGLLVPYLPFGHTLLVHRIAPYTPRCRSPLICSSADPPPDCLPPAESGVMWIRFVICTMYRIATKNPYVPCGTSTRKTFSSARTPPSHTNALTTSETGTFKPQLQDQNRVLYSGLDHLQVSRTVFLPITPEGVRIPGASAPFGDKAPNCRSETNPATPPGLFAARQKNPQAILPNAPLRGDKVGGRRFFSRQDAAENGQD